MVKRIHPQPRIVRTGQESVARSQAGSQYAEVFVPLLLQPIQAAPYVHHRLAASRERAANVGAHGVVRALQLHWPPNIVVGLREPERRNPHLVEDRAQRVVAERVCVPLRHHHNGLLGPLGILVRRRWVPARIHQIVFRKWRPLRRSEAQKLRRRNLSLHRLLLDRRVLGQRLRAHVGGKQLRMPLFQPEVGGPLVAEKFVAVANKKLIDEHHGGLG